MIFHRVLEGTMSMAITDLPVDEAFLSTGRGPQKESTAPPLLHVSVPALLPEQLARFTLAALHAHAWARFVVLFTAARLDLLKRPR